MFPRLAKLSTPAENLGQNVRGQSVLAKLSYIHALEQSNIYSCQSTLQVYLLLVVNAYCCK